MTSSPSTSPTTRASTSPISSPASPLAGLRVVDWTETPDAITASTLLADLGAEVTLIEPDAGRHRARALEDLWAATIRNKRVASPAPAERAALLEAADVLIAEPWLPELPVIAAAHPHLVVVLTSPFGADGPLAGQRGHGRAGEAFGGQVFASGDPHRPPLHSGFPIGASATALLAAIGAVAAVLERDAGGGRGPLGQTVDVAGYEAVLRFMEFLPIFHRQTGFRNERTGNQSAYQVPVATWRCVDGGFVTFTGNTNDIVHRLYRAMGRPELIEDPRFATNEARVAHRAIVEPTLADWAARQTRDALVAACEANRVPVGVVFTIADLFADPHVAARGSLERVDGATRPRAVPRFGFAPAAAPVAPAPGPARRAPGPASRPGPLAGLRVIDLGQVLAGPLCAALLGDLGADVIKVEKRDGGDDFRRQAPLHGGLSLWWTASAHDKRSIALDLKRDDDRALFLRLVAEADVVTANFVPGTLERLGLGFDDLRRVNPSIVLVFVSGYGPDGPYRDRRAFGRNAEAFGGLASVTGYADGVPMPTGFPVADGFSAAFGALGAVASLYRSRRGPRGAMFVDVALYETILRLLEVPVRLHDRTGVVPAASDSASAMGETFAVREAEPGCFVSTSGWQSEPDRATTTPVLSIDRLVDSPQVRARGSILRREDPTLGEVALVGVVPHFGRTPGEIHRTAPALDADRAAILRDWLGEAFAEEAREESADERAEAPSAGSRADRRSETPSASGGSDG
ncbi:MAG: CoA transferase [Myxococcota bacterium]